MPKTNYLTSLRINSFTCQMILAYSFVGRWNAVFWKLWSAKKQKCKINTYHCKEHGGIYKESEEKFMVPGL